MRIMENDVAGFKDYLKNEERAESTISKYLAEIKSFTQWLCDRALDKTVAIEYKVNLLKEKSPRSVNVGIAALNKFFKFIGASECCLKSEKIQVQAFAIEDKELSRSEYKRLLAAAKSNERLYYMLKTFTGTGIRVSELKSITVEAARKREAIITNKGKTRMVLIEESLSKDLIQYAKRHNIKSGSIFITRTGKPIDRTNVWREMKKLCEKAYVSKKKVFPHNFRHLFARMFYSIEKNLVKLASVLGHSNINTTRIYTLETRGAHRSVLRKIAVLADNINNIDISENIT